MAYNEALSIKTCYDISFYIWNMDIFFIDLVNIRPYLLEYKIADSLSSILSMIL